MADAPQGDPLPEHLPRHIAVIMDGNGRWAERRGLPRHEGHRAGGESVGEIISECLKLRIPYLTLYAFSTENWKRPIKEVRFLMGMLKEFLSRERKLITEHNVRIRAIGDLSRLPSEVAEEVRKAEDIGRGNTALTLSVGLNYGGRADILQAARRFAEDCLSGRAKASDLNEETFAGYLTTAGIPDPDLLIRTAGEMRVSNFLLWQISYSEIYISDVLWPDFRAPQLHEALREYARRERRYGATSESK
ncbi:MAG TPA: isoprenyl transferase [Candidatus Brocadiia bacterium]|nr:isoprenyl transferase [Candidatus Brocadiia bacterium]